MGFAKNTEVKRTESKSLHPYKNEIWNLVAAAILR